MRRARTWRVGQMEGALRKRRRTWQERAQLERAVHVEWVVVVLEVRVRGERVWRAVQVEWAVAEGPPASPEPNWGPDPLESWPWGRFHRGALGERGGPRAQRSTIPECRGLQIQEAGPPLGASSGLPACEATAGAPTSRMERSTPSPGRRSTQDDE